MTSRYHFGIFSKTTQKFGKNATVDHIDKIVCCRFLEINYISLIQQDHTVCCHNSMLYNSSFSIVEMM